jgi:diacylglycerol O-acyltransferase / wax synthase
VASSWSVLTLGLSDDRADNPPVSIHTQPQRIPGRDVHFFYEERATQPMHTLKLLTFELEPGRPDLGLSEVREALGVRIRTLAPLRRRLQRVPFGLFHPVWVDAGDPDLDVHVRAVAVQAPGGRRELGQLLSRLAMAPLDRSRPLWELWLIEGLPEGRMALALKLHHTVADGNSSARIIAHLLGGESQGEHLARDHDPSALELLAGALPELARALARGGSNLRRAMRAGAAAAEVRRSHSVRLAKPFTGPAMPWSKRPTMRRTFGYVSLDLADLRVVQDARGCTSAELVLALLGGALRSYLADRSLPAGAHLSATVPVSIRPPEERAEWGNHVGNVFVELGGELSDPLERLHAISATMSAVRAHRAELDLEHWDDVWQLYPLMRAGYLASLIVGRRALRRPTFSVIASSVTGPPAPLSCGPARLTAIHALGVLTEDLGLNLTTWSYDGQLSFGLSSCPEFVPDVWDLLERIPIALAELTERASRAAARA